MLPWASNHSITTTTAGNNNNVPYTTTQSRILTLHTPQSKFTRQALLGQRVDCESQILKKSPEDKDIP
ncbi:hypothetical protein Pmani_036968 [Petrolisthes manimaculis]|uniref:Uncharacterized protein n=1 Tax=Petrolisthes manimaculis TaxID=1843537 RepID=A0AAE1TNV7_9EUCA|nr:hypothetical protein Pmani_036968 [Petrolisthes manimaculis]